MLFATSASAIRSLQLGEGATGDWTYDAGTQTWVTTSTEFQLLATANADGSEDYAWDAEGASTQTAYLVVSATPKTMDDETFNITLSNDSASLRMVSYGYGTPPLSDSNALAPHGIFDTYFEVYEFTFDGTAGMISNTQPGETGMGEGYEETFDVVINSVIDGGGVHFDLFTMEGDGLLVLGGEKEMNAFAAFSHDAEYTSAIPEPAAALVFGVGLLVVGSRVRRE